MKKTCISSRYIVPIVALMAVSRCRNEMQRAWSEDVLRRHDFSERYEQSSQPDSTKIVDKSYLQEIDQLADLTEKCLFLMRDSIESDSPVDFNHQRFRFLESMAKLEVAFSLGLRNKASDEGDTP